ncbi:MAG: GntR family transcriptional regulator [Negativicutes bacterium]
MINKKTGGLPAYKQIQDWISRKIQHGEWPSHYKLPSEDELSIQFNVARGTVRQALQGLVTVGAIYRMHGKGTFVASSQIEHKLEGEFLSFLEELVKKNVPFAAKVVEKAVESPFPPISTYLCLSEKDNQIFRLRRLREIGDNSLMLSDNHVPYGLFPDIETLNFNSQALYSVMEDNYDIHIAWAKRIFQAQAAQGNIAALLKVPAGTPLMFVEQLVYDNKGRCIDCAHLWLHADLIRFTITLNRHHDKICYTQSSTK